MFRGFQASVSVACLAAVSMCCGYAVSREKVHRKDPQTVYRQINRESFHGSLPDVPVTWAYLENRQGQTKNYGGRATEIELNLTLVTSDQDLKATLQHEACHVAVGPDVVKSLQDEHGQLWQKCMKRFN
jgi:SprT-like family